VKTTIRAGMKRRIAFATVRFRIETRTSSVMSSTKIVASPAGSVFRGQNWAAVAQYRSNSSPST